MRFATLAVSAATTIALASSAMAGVAYPAPVVYTDSSTDLPSSGTGLLNILSVAVSHDAASIKFRLTLDGISNPYNTNQYGLALSTPGAATKTTAVWANQASFASNGGMNYTVRADPAYNGRTFFQSHGANGWSPNAENQNSGIGTNYDTNTLDIYVSRAAIGMDADATLFFDVWAIALNNSVFDALSTNATLGGYSSDFTTTNALSYTIGNPVPAPGAIALLGAAGLLGSRRRRA
jgi:hypothetical protein